MEITSPFIFMLAFGFYLAIGILQFFNIKVFGILKIILTCGMSYYDLGHQEHSKF